MTITYCNAIKEHVKSHNGKQVASQLSYSSKIKQRLCMLKDSGLKVIYYNLISHNRIIF